MHENDMRKTGEPYITHPTRVASFLISLGITDESTLIAAMLHDVIEDCDVTAQGLIKINGVPEEAVKAVEALSKESGKSTQTYYRDISNAGIAAMLVKISDRCHNVSTMVGAFSVGKMGEYLDETVTYVLPMCSFVRRFYPEYSDQVCAMEYMLESLTSTISGLLTTVGGGKCK